MNGLSYILVLNHRSKRLKSFSLTTVIEQYTARGNFCNFVSKQRLFAYPNPPYNFHSLPLLPTSYSTICRSRERLQRPPKKNMAKSFLSLILLLSLVSASIAGNHQLGWIPSQSTCQGTVGECVSGDEFAMDSDSNRRILATSQYISYEALKRNSVPCSRRGASYYNCRAGAQANPYRRGCSAITRCRS